MKVKDQPLDTMVRHRHTLNDALYNSIQHIKGVGKRSDYTENGLVALVKQIALDKNTLDPPPKEMQKTVLPPKPTNKKVSKSRSQTRPQATNKSTASSHTTSLLGQGSTNIGQHQHSQQRPWLSRCFTKAKQSCVQINNFSAPAFTTNFS